MRTTRITLSAAVCTLLWLGAWVPASAGTMPVTRLIPDSSQVSALYGVFCTSPANCWSVGTFPATSGAGGNLALHWNGHVWSGVATPDPGGTGPPDFNALFAVSCGSAADCWAVGDVFTTTGQVALDQALHWNGRKWSAISVPQPGGKASGDSSALLGVRCRPSGTCWAVGDSQKGTGQSAPILNQALRWNGRKWSAVTIPNPAGLSKVAFNVLNGLSCTSETDCWAVGYAGHSNTATLNQALHWNGRTWSKARTPNPGGNGGPTHDSNLLGAYCTSARNCWAVGNYVSPGNRQFSLNQVLHWNGRSWIKAAAPSPGTGTGGTNTLRSVTCTTATNCWAVGQYRTGSNGPVLNQALHWNGRRWSLVATPDPGGTTSGDSNSLNGVRCASSVLCFAVGNSQAGTYFTLLWNGHHWSTD